MRKIFARATLTAVLCAALHAPSADAQIRRFNVDQPDTRNLGVWRLTNDPAVRDEGNYHNIQCWSPNGRYTCYTHWNGSEGPGGKASAQVHVVDLSTGEDRLVGKGINPRWANRHNRLFYSHWTLDGTEPYETGTQVIQYDADTGEKAVIAHGMEIPGGMDPTDTWLYGTQRYRGRKPQYITVRVRNQPNSTLEVIRGAPNLHAYIHVNPRHPVIMVRAKDLTDKIYGTCRAMFDLDGSNLRPGVVMCENGHMSWSGDGTYLLIGNRQACGRPWDRPFPSDLEVLSCGSVGDICPCGKSGRYICGGSLNLVDTRSGDAWTLIRPYSLIVYPMEGDFSTPYDIDPKGSPDGTKVHYHSTRNLDNATVAQITKYDRKQPDVIHVDSTEGFPESGDIVCRWEVIGYSRKTPTTFEGLTRRKYGTRPAPEMVRKVQVIFPLPECILSEKDRARGKPDHAMIKAGIGKDNPLLYQCQTDCYVVVARRPDPPHLRVREGRVELIPGESHWETRGYRILRDGKPVAKELIGPGEAFALPEAASYTAAAVEWSGLESTPSLPLKVAARTDGKALSDKPSDFSWTRECWTVDGKELPRAEAMKTAHAVMEQVHLHDGAIAREEWRNGERVSRVDLNKDGKPIRHQEFRHGKLAKQTYKTPEGYLASEELYGPDGFKTEYVRYYTRESRRGREFRRWWYDGGRPVKKTTRGKVVFDTTAARKE